MTEDNEKYWEKHQEKLMQEMGYMSPDEDDEPDEISTYLSQFGGFSGYCEYLNSEYDKEIQMIKDFFAERETIYLHINNTELNESWKQDKSFHWHQWFVALPDADVYYLTPTKTLHELLDFFDEKPIIWAYVVISSLYSQIEDMKELTKVREGKEGSE